MSDLEPNPDTFPVMREGGIIIHDSLGNPIADATGIPLSVNSIDIQEAISAGNLWLPATLLTTKTIRAGNRIQLQGNLNTMCDSCSGDFSALSVATDYVNSTVERGDPNVFVSTALAGARQDELLISAAKEGEETTGSAIRPAGTTTIDDISLNGNSLAAIIENEIYSLIDLSRYVANILNAKYCLQLLKELPEGQPEPAACYQFQPPPGGP